MREAREAAGLTRTAIAERTRIPERLIAKIEEGDFAGLPSRAYATGFSRSYARAVGIDEDEILDAVRRELGMVAQNDTTLASGMEPGDPARIPTARFAWLLGLGALLVVAVGLFFWRSYYSPSVALPSILPEETQAAAPSVAALPMAGTPTDASASAIVSEAPDPSVTSATRPHPRVTHAVHAPARVPVLPSATPVVTAPVAQVPSASTVSN